MDIYGPKVSHLVTATYYIYIIYIYYIYIYIIYIIYIYYIYYIYYIVYIYALFQPTCFAVFTRPPAQSLWSWTRSRRRRKKRPGAPAHSAAMSFH